MKIMGTWLTNGTRCSELASLIHSPTLTRGFIIKLFLLFPKQKNFVRIALVHTAFQPIHGVEIVALRSARWHRRWRRCINLCYRET